MSSEYGVIPMVSNDEENNGISATHKSEQEVSFEDLDAAIEH